MRGLILKDLYVMKQNFKSYFIIATGFLAIGCASTADFYLVFLPLLFCSMIPIVLLRIDETSKWLKYSATMPYTKGQIVSEKYLIGLGAQAIMLFIILIAQVLQNHTSNIFILMVLLIGLSLFASSLVFPFMFGFGYEKASWIYIICIICSRKIISPNWLSDEFLTEIKLNGFLPIICFVGVGVFALSWYLSILFYKRREM